MSRPEKTNANAFSAAAPGPGCSSIPGPRAKRRGISCAHGPQAGFTIVEVLVAVVVFGVGLLAIAGMQTRSIEQATFSDQMTMRATVVTHWAETLSRLPVRDETVGIDTGSSFAITASTMFSEGTACEYGETCDWDYIVYNDKKPHAVRQKITRGYPLPNLVMIEMEAVPRGVDDATAERRAVRTAYVRSLRWN